MKLETALQIIDEQAQYLYALRDLSMTYEEYLENVGTDGFTKLYEEFIEEDRIDFNTDGAHVEEYCCSTWGIENPDESKMYVTVELQEGGEGCGDEYTYVFKIKHPTHGEGLIQYVGYYDSWNGTDWSSTTPVMVEEFEYTAIGYRPTKG